LEQNLSHSKLVLGRKLKAQVKSQWLLLGIKLKSQWSVLGAKAKSHLSTLGTKAYWE
jgi:hypothetical protein